MIEPLRSQYLAALGIESYVPRFVLPGAKLSEPCAWLDANAAPLLDAASGAEESAHAVAPRESNAEPAIKRSAPVLDDLGVKNPAARSADMQQAAAHNTAVQPAESQPAAAPQFSISVAITQGRILLLDYAPTSNAERNAYQAMMAKMLSALRPAAAQLRLEIFAWPPRLPRVANDADAAREQLSAYLQKLIHQHAIDTVLVLGDLAQQWCELTGDAVRVVTSSSLLACVKDPALKRPLWDDIRHLAEQ